VIMHGGMIIEYHMNSCGNLSLRTHRVHRYESKREVVVEENFLHIFDYNATSEYKIIVTRFYGTTGTTGTTATTGKANN
jgi:hypothetical protein